MLDKPSSIQLRRCGPINPPGVDAALAAAMEDKARLRAALLRVHAGGRLFRAIIDNAPLLISTKDLQGKILTADRISSFFGGLRRSQLVGKNIFEIFPDAVVGTLWAND